MKLIALIIELLGLGWLMVIICIAILGGRVLIQLKNPFTKKLDVITDVSLKVNNEENYGS